jgi:hypothetical protein
MRKTDIGAPRRCPPGRDQAVQGRHAGPERGGPVIFRRDVIGAFDFQRGQRDPFRCGGPAPEARHWRTIELRGRARKQLRVCVRLIWIAGSCRSFSPTAVMSSPLPPGAYRAWTASSSGYLESQVCIRARRSVSRWNSAARTRSLSFASRTLPLSSKSTVL